MRPTKLYLAAALLLTACHTTPKKADKLQEYWKAALKDSADFNREAGTFALDAPEGWRKVDTVINGIRFAVIVSNQFIDGFHPNVNAFSGGDMKGVPLDQYFDQSLAGVEQSFDGYRLIEKGSKNINGVDARWARVAVSRNGKNIEIMTTIMAKHGIAYHVTCSALAGSYAKFASDFDTIVDSFRLK